MSESVCVKVSVKVSSFGTGIGEGSHQAAHTSRPLLIPAHDFAGPSLKIESGRGPIVHVIPPSLVTRSEVMPLEPTV